MKTQLTDPKWKLARRRRMVKSYGVRDISLQKLGFSSYREYLLSDLWRGIRKQVLIRDHFTCICGSRATEVHHNSYSIKVMSGRNTDRLVSLCNRCHERAEFNWRGKATVQEAKSGVKAQAYAMNDAAYLSNPAKRASKKMRRAVRLLTGQKLPPRATVADALPLLREAQTLVTGCP